MDRNIKITLGVLMLGVLTLVGYSVSTRADDSALSAGFGISNGACGTGEQTANIRYDRDSDDTPAHFRLQVGPNGSCTGQGVTVDAFVAQRQYRGDNLFFQVAAGYDSRTVPFEYIRTDVSSDPFKHFHGERVEAIQALIGVGYDCGDNCSVRVSYNVVDTPLLAGGNVSPLQVGITYQLLDSLEVNFSLNDTVQSVDLAWENDGMVISSGITYGATDLDNGAPAAFDGGYVQAGAPEPLYSVSFGWKL